MLKIVKPVTNLHVGQKIVGSTEFKVDFGHPWKHVYTILNIEQTCVGQTMCTVLTVKIERSTDGHIVEHRMRLSPEQLF